MRRMDPTWAAEFRGFFWGEGCLDVAFFHRPKNALPSYTPRARIGLHEIDRPLLVDIQRHLGGTLYDSAKCRSCTWQLTGKANLDRLVVVLRGGVLPAVKRLQLDDFAAAVAAIPVRGQNYTPERREFLAASKARLETLKRGA